MNANLTSTKNALSLLALPLLTTAALLMSCGLPPSPGEDNEPEALASTAQALGPPTINPGGVVNAINYTTNIHAGDYVAIFGTNLSTSTASCWPGAEECGGAFVVIGPYIAPITYASPYQVNVIVPWQATGNRPLVVAVGTQLSQPYWFYVQ